MPNENPLIGECVAVLAQGLALLTRLDDISYAGTGGLPVESGAGGHLRHCLDFYRSFLSGVGTGRVDYDRRARDARIERDREYAMREIAAVIAGLRSLPAGDAPLLVRHESAETMSEEQRWSRSSLARELQFLLSHTVHHYALIALMLKIRGLDPGAEFGVAPSTLRHWKGEALCAR